MEGFQLPTSAILILSHGSGWHGNLILGEEGTEGGGGGGEWGDLNSFFKHTPCQCSFSLSNFLFVSSHEWDLNFEFTVSSFSGVIN